MSQPSNFNGALVDKVERLLAGIRKAIKTPGHDAERIRRILQALLEEES